MKRTALFLIITASFAGAFILDWRAALLMILAQNADKLLGANDKGSDA